MLNENEIPFPTTVDDHKHQIRMGRVVTHRKGGRAKGSIRELELIAADLRRGGEINRADEVDREIMAILDKKICRKIIKRSRKEQKMLHIGSC
ncbi:MAG: hypothetical protein B6D77_14790 [gamma proteobacterium symbiont of Ctena orbiculata]|nr:MAG: hypothetical protein B6D77_14790 [gamma proteobacterium symbiont of Ctena orbiculata]PVV21136.1 MAG: hypothetical protein B6D78_08735 [gamma proteobacterium symbiont of Ctena orbiculata]PVV27177.1 MAG: hypothetical protein B6D79_03765 [gamma proteobacterium symbiont of Ctena orbiculata]